MRGPFEDIIEYELGFCCYAFLPFVPAVPAERITESLRMNVSKKDE